MDASQAEQNTLYNQRHAQWSEVKLLQKKNVGANNSPKMSQFKYADLTTIHFG